MSWIGMTFSGKTGKLNVLIKLGMGWKMGKNCTQSVEYDPRVVSVIKVKGTVSSHIEKHDCKTVRKKCFISY